MWGEEIQRPRLKKLLHFDRAYNNIGVYIYIHGWTHRMHQESRMPTLKNKNKKINGLLYG